MAVEQGGQFSMNLTHAVTHTIANDKKGFRYMAAAQHGDVVHYNWFLECVRRETLLLMKPKHYLHLSDTTKKKLQQEMDVFGDSFFESIEEDDLKQVFSNMDASKLSVAPAQVAYYERKYCPTAKECLFRGCHLYIAPPLHSANLNSRVVADCTLQRLALEVAMYGGSEAEQLAPDVTHVVAYSPPEQPIAFQSILASLPSSLAPLLGSQKVHVVSHTWVEESLEAVHRQNEDDYEIRPPSARIGDSQDLLKSMGVVQPEPWLRDKCTPRKGNRSSLTKGKRLVCRSTSRGHATSETAVKLGSKGQMVQKVGRGPQSRKGCQTERGGQSVAEPAEERVLVKTPPDLKDQENETKDISRVLKSVKRRRLTWDEAEEERQDGDSTALNTPKEEIHKRLDAAGENELQKKNGAGKHFEIHGGRDPHVAEENRDEPEHWGHADDRQDDPDSFLDEFLPRCRQRDQSTLPLRSLPMIEADPSRGAENQNGHFALISGASEAGPSKRTSDDTDGQCLVFRTEPAGQSKVRNLKVSREEAGAGCKAVDQLQTCAGKSLQLIDDKPTKKQKVSYRDLVSKLLNPD